MNEKTRGIFRLIVGGYLIYLGVSLAMDVIKAKPDNFVIFVIAGVVFVAVGAILVVKNIKAVMAASQEEDEPDDIAEDSGIDETDFVQDDIEDREIIDEIQESGKEEEKEE